MSMLYRPLFIELTHSSDGNRVAINMSLVQMMMPRTVNGEVSGTSLFFDNNDPLNVTEDMKTIAEHPSWRAQ